MYQSILLRLIRAALATLFPALLAIYQGNPWYQAATPILMMLAKAARNKWPGNPWIKLIPF